MKKRQLKILLPTLREKKRYIAFQVISEEGEEFSYSDLESAIWSVLLDFLGEEGVSKTSVWLLKDCWDQKLQKGILRCNNKSVQKVIASLGLIDRLGDNRITFKILKISGTIKGVKRV
ncbi:MAG: Rpp14/Pop5 family protein [Candidatus Aenigmarchaeota archaeon]|nr:Rpp14/Pop5 family protein [Candidatus Aenigmarchaeota archaeon]